MKHRSPFCIAGAVLFGCSGQAPSGLHHAQHHRAHSGHHGFDDADQWAKVFDDPDRDRWQKPDEVVGLLELEPGMVVADLGAGTGYFLARLSRAVGPEGQVLALDVEEDMVRYMTERKSREQLGNVSVRRIPFDDPGLAPQSTDRVLIVDTWHHISDRIAYTKKLAAALEPGARLCIVDFTLEAERGPPAGHRVSADVARAELEAAGLEVELMDESLPDQYVLVGTKPRPRGE